MSEAAKHEPQIEPPNPTAAALVEIARNTVPAAQPLLPMTLVQRAFEAGNLELVERAMQLQERWEQNQARKAFDAALAAVRAEVPVILKNRAVDFTSQKGRTNYRYEDLAGIAAQVDPVLAKHGLSYRFRTTVDGQSLKVTCIVSHALGYSEENSLSASHDNSGNKNSIQAVGSTQTYLQRYTLKAALGLAASEDTDGRTPAMTYGNDTGELISHEQQNQIIQALAVREMPHDRLIKWINAASRSKHNVQQLGDIPVHLFQLCLDKIRTSGDPQ